MLRRTLSLTGDGTSGEAIDTCEASGPEHRLRVLPVCTVGLRDAEPRERNRTTHASDLDAIVPGPRAHCRPARSSTDRWNPHRDLRAVQERARRLRHACRGGFLPFAKSADPS